MPLADHHKNAAKEVFVRSDKPITAMFFGEENNGVVSFTCGVPFTYLFSEGLDYEVLFEWHYERS